MLITALPNARLAKHSTCFAVFFNALYHCELYEELGVKHLTSLHKILSKISLPFKNQTQSTSEGEAIDMLAISAINKLVL